MPRGCSLSAATGSMKCTSCPNCRRPRRYWRTAHVAPPWYGSPAIIPATMIVSRPAGVAPKRRSRRRCAWCGTAAAIDRLRSVGRTTTGRMNVVAPLLLEPGDILVHERELQHVRRLVQPVSSHAPPALARLPARRSRGRRVRSPSQTTRLVVTEPVVGRRRRARRAIPCSRCCARHGHSSISWPRLPAGRVPPPIPRGTPRSAIPARRLRDRSAGRSGAARRSIDGRDGHDHQRDERQHGHASDHRRGKSFRKRRMSCSIARCAVNSPSGRRSPSGSPCP